MKCTYCDRTKIESHKPVPICALHYQRYRKTGSFDAPSKDRWYKPYIAGGYYRINLNGKHTPYHRYLMEIHLGRKLSSREYIHHINGNKLDNRIENLIITDVSEHVRKYHPKKSAIDWSKYVVPEPVQNYHRVKEVWRNTPCLVDNCHKMAKSRGLCMPHYTSYYDVVLSKVRPGHG